MEQSKGNPKAPVSDNKEANEKVYGSSTEFFEKLETEVNGAIDDSLVDQIDQQETLDARNEPPAIQQGLDANAQATPPNRLQGNSNSNVDWEKRYKDSSKEAVKLAAKVKQFKQIEPLMQVMRKDEGLVNHIKDYLQSGGKPSKTVKEELGLGDDFHYDPNEALEDPKSDSAKVFDAQVDRAVKEKVSRALGEKEKQNAEVVKKQRLVAFANKFQKEKNLSGEDMKAVLKKAASSKISFDEAYYLLNRGNQARNIQNNARQDVAKQMENVRNIPQSVSQTNSAPTEKSPTDDVFDALIGSDDNVDNLFG